MANDDDDVPLAALAAKGPVKAPKLDDDTPLASLAKAAAPGAAKKPANPGAKRLSVTPAKGKGKGATGKKRAASSSSSTSSDSSSDSSGRPLAKKKGGAKAKAKKGALKRTQTAEDMDGDEAQNKVSKKARNIKEDVVAQLLCRWWFSAPYQANDWPPQEESWYVKELKEKKMRKVEMAEWEWVAEEDNDGLKKVYELSQFRGLFRNSAGELVDMRPKDTCPCYNNFMQKDVLVLCDMLLSAYENQLKELLAKSKYNVEGVANGIKTSMTKIRDTQAKARDNQHRR